MGNDFAKEVAIDGKHISKKYKRKKEYFYALCDVSLRIYKGQAVGIMGMNGSGKSTLSFLLAEILEPDEGECRIDGEVSLLTIKTGLQKQLTGMENICLKAMFLGISKEELDCRIDEVVEFAELGEYLYMPVKQYSTGMVSRLGFAINFCLDSDIYIIDEALSVGDKMFAAKCIEKMRELKARGKTILFVSHALGQMREFCDIGIWMDAGRIREIGDIKEVLRHYEVYANEYKSQTASEKAESVRRCFQSRLSKKTRGTMVLRCGIRILQGLYCLCKLLPVQDKILFLSRQSDTVPLDFDLLQNEIGRLDPRTNLKILCKTLSTKKRIGYGIHMLHQMIEIATAKVVVLDSYCILVSILKHRESLRVIQIWHSMGTMKKFGYAILDQKEGTLRDLAHLMKMHRNYDYVIASSPAYSAHLEEAFRCEKQQVQIYSLPRVDWLLDPEREKSIKQKLYRAYPSLQNKKLILYCPTFRKEERVLEEKIRELAFLIKEQNIQLVVKLHPLSKVKLGDSIMTLDAFDTFSCLFVADAVISDYSCIVYEAALRQIPVYFYVFDKQEYMQNRGLFLDFDQEFSKIVYEEPASMMDTIQRQCYDSEELKRLSNKYVVNRKETTFALATFILKVKKNEI